MIKDIKIVTKSAMGNSLKIINFILILKKSREIKSDLPDFKTQPYRSYCGQLGVDGHIDLLVGKRVNLGQDQAVVIGIFSLFQGVYHVKQMLDDSLGQGLVLGEGFPNAFLYKKSIKI